MSEFHCLDIEFPDVDFSPCFDSSNTEVANSFHAHLYVFKDEIELKVFYEEDIYRCFVRNVRSLFDAYDHLDFELENTLTKGLN